MAQVIRVNGEYRIVSETTVIDGDLVVTGETTTISSEDLVIEDNLIVLNYGEPGAGVTRGISGIEIDRGSLDDPHLVWDESQKGWVFELPDPGQGVLQVSGPFVDDEDYVNRLLGRNEPNDLPNKEYVDYKFRRSGRIDNVYFVQKAGNDDNPGISWNWAFATVERAMQRAFEVQETNPDAITLIELGPGEYETEGHIDMPDNTFLRSMHRAAIFKPKPGFEERNVFRMGSGCFIEGPVFDGFRIDDLENPTEGFAVCFRPGANIRRTPYAHKIVVRNTPTWGVIAPPLDRENGNPLVPRGAGVALADGTVCSPNSIYPNIMCWGATPVAHNGIGYCAKLGGLVNAVNAVSIWAHIHFLAIDGGQLILSSCSNQFGDFSMKSKGYRMLPLPDEVQIPLIQLPSDADLIEQNRQQIIDQMWIALENNPTPATSYVLGWTEELEFFTRRDADTLLQCLIWVLQSANEKPMLDFAKGLFNLDKDATLVFTFDKLDAFIFSWENIRSQILSIPGFSTPGVDIVDALFNALISTITAAANSPTAKRTLEPSLITSIGHTWSSIFAGVAMTKVPPARNLGKILDSIIEEDQGMVIASGQDDQGSALFIGGMEIQADTGELSGPPFDRAVNRVATKAAIARSF